MELQEIEPGRWQTIATLPGTGGGASLMLNGHTDINTLTRRWRRDPWTPALEGDRLYGHGVQNMKGGLATIIMVAVRRGGRTPGCGPSRGAPIRAVHVAYALYGLS